MSITVQQDATIYSLLYFCKLLYMFRVVIPPIIRSTYNCNYSIWHWSNRLCYIPLLWGIWNWWVELPSETCRAVYRNTCIRHCVKSHFVGQLLTRFIFLTAVFPFFSTLSRLFSQPTVSDWLSRGLKKKINLLPPQKFCGMLREWQKRKGGFIFRVIKTLMENPRPSKLRYTARV
jgi:hypothetical protein